MINKAIVEEYIDDFRKHPVRVVFASLILLVIFLLSFVPRPDPAIRKLREKANSYKSLGLEDKAKELEDKAKELEDKGIFAPR